MEDHTDTDTSAFDPMADGYIEPTHVIPRLFQYNGALKRMAAWEICEFLEIKDFLNFSSLSEKYRKQVLHKDNGCVGNMMKEQGYPTQIVKMVKQLNSQITIHFLLV